jgi:segregation and condensation protein B
LPASDVLSSRQIDDWLKNATNAPVPTDTDMGLADEQLPLEAVVVAGAAASPAAAAAVEATPAVVAIDEAQAPKSDETQTSA